MIKGLVLHIEDDEYYRVMFSRLAAKVFEEIKSADSLEEARAIVEAGKPAVCFLDLNLESTQGQATLEAYQTMFPSIPVIVLTGTDDLELPDDLPVLHKLNRPSALDYLEAARSAILKGVSVTHCLDKLGELAEVLSKAIQDYREDHA